MISDPKRNLEAAHEFLGRAYTKDPDKPAPVCCIQERDGMYHTQLCRAVTDLYARHAQEVEALREALAEARAGRDAWMEANRRERIEAWERVVAHLTRLSPFSGHARAELLAASTVVRTWIAMERETRRPVAALTKGTPMTTRGAPLDLRALARALVLLHGKDVSAEREDAFRGALESAYAAGRSSWGDAGERKARAWDGFRRLWWEFESEGAEQAMRIISEYVGEWEHANRYALAASPPVQPIPTERGGPTPTGEAEEATTKMGPHALECHRALVAIGDRHGLKGCEGGGSDEPCYFPRCIADGCDGAGADGPWNPEPPPTCAADMCPLEVLRGYQFCREHLNIERAKAGLTLVDERGYPIPTETPTTDKETP